MHTEKRLKAHDYTMEVYRVTQKIGTRFYALTLPNIMRFSKLFHCQNQETICNNTSTNDFTPPHVCRYTTLWNVSVLKATTENKTTSITTHFKKLTTGNNVFIVSVVIVQSNCHILQVLHQIIIIIIYLLHKSIKRTKYRNMNSGAGQQGKALTAAQKLQNYTKLYKTKIKIQINICNSSHKL